MYPTLRDFLDVLEREGELHRVKAKVSPLLEVTAIADRVSKSPAAKLSDHALRFDPRHHHLGGKALLFENVEGAAFPLAINVFGSYRRLEMALGCVEGGFEALAARIEKLIKPEPPVGLMDKLRKLPELVKLAGYAPKVVRSGLCQQVVKTGEQVNLFELPIIKCWPSDGDPRKVGYPVDVPAGGGDGRFITLGGMYTIHPDDAGVDGPCPSRNIGMYRAQVLDRTHTAMHWHMHHDGARHWRAWKKLGKPMPLAIALGGESVLPYAATAPMPPGVSELLLAAFLNDAGIELVACKTIDMHVPAHSEIVIEGFVSTEAGFPGYDPRDREAGPIGPGAVFEGPFGDHTGFYSLPDRYPVFEVTAVTHRRDAIYPATVVGLPPQEDYYLGKATERVFLPLLKTMVGDIVDYDLPMFGAFHNCAFVKIRKEYPLQARRVMHAIWGAGQMSWTKILVVVDEDVDVHDHEQVLFHLCANCDPGRDVEVVNGPLDILDHAAPRLGAGHKMGFDATRKIKGEEVGGHAVRDYPPILKMDEDVLARVANRWGEYGFEG
ncbi:MAG: menaquinone biosynthesis decarboxylase [Phycisphaeraceae bacterium]|nr:menaquinone biosynthesis decarboxylase [Phycisphaeraceae bacterium]